MPEWNKTILIVGEKRHFQLMNQQASQFRNSYGYVFFAKHVILLHHSMEISVNFNFEFNKFSEKCTVVKLFSVLWIFAQIYVVQGAVLYRTRQVAPVSHWCTRFFNQLSPLLVQFLYGIYHVTAAAICQLGDWNVLTKPVRANQQKLVKIEEESTIGQLLKLWAQPRRPAGKTKNSSFLHIKILDLLNKCFIMNQKGQKSISILILPHYLVIQNGKTHYQFGLVLPVKCTLAHKCNN